MADFDFNELKDKLEDMNNTADTTSSYDPADVTKNKGMAILAYFSWLVLIPLLCAKESRFARFHSNQGLLLAIIETIAGIIFGALRGIPLIGWVFAIIGAAVEIVMIVMLVIGVVNAANGRAKELPVIGTIHLLNEQ